VADLEAAADVALVKIKDLSAHVDKAEAAFTAVEERLDDVRTQFATDWAALDEKTRVLLELARAQAAGIAEEGEEARQGLTGLEESLARAASEWDDAIERSGSETSTFTAHVSEKEPVISQARHETEAASRSLAERAAAIEAQLQQAVTEARDLLEGDVAGELKEMRDAVRQRASALGSVLAGECGAILDEAFASWEQQVAQVEEVIDQEFASARQHAADVVEFALKECRQGHEDAWAEIGVLVASLDALLQGLGEAVRARTGEVGERWRASEQALADAAAAVECMRSALTQELEMLARYEFVQGR
jgi:hypothetical protein